MASALTSIWAFKISLTLALVLLWLGYAQRRQQRRHMVLGIGAAVVTLLAAVYLVVLVEFVGVEFRTSFPPAVVLIHRIFSAVTLVLIVSQLVTGLMRLPQHKHRPLLLLAFYTVSVASGWVIF